MLEMRAQKRVVFGIGSILLVAALCVADASDSEAEAAPKSSKVKVRVGRSEGESKPQATLVVIKLILLGARRF